MLREPDLLDEVQLAIDDILGALVIQHAQQEADDPLDDEGIALPAEVDTLAIVAGGDPYTALAALDEVGRRLVRLGERCELAPEIDEQRIAIHPVIECCEVLDDLVL